MPPGTTIPCRSEKLTHQIQQTDVNDDFFNSLFEPPKYISIHRAFQILCFIIFLGPFKIICSCVLALIWMVTIYILPLFEGIFKTTFEFKTWCHKIMRSILRALLFTLGIVRIDIEGKPQDDTRFLISNHLSIFDFAIHFCSTGYTVIKKANEPGMESLILGSAIDVFYLKHKKRVSPSEQLQNLASDPSFLPILLFPEDSPTNGNAVLAFRTAAFYSEYVIQPVSISYSLGLTPSGFNTIASGDSFSFGLLMRVVSTPFITARLKYLPVDRVKEASVDAAHQAEACQLRIANDLGALAISRSGKAKKD